MSVPNGQTAIVKLNLVNSWTVKIEKQFGIKSVGLLKKHILMLYKERNNNKAKLIVDMFNWLPKQFQFFVSLFESSLLESYVVATFIIVLTFKALVLTFKTVYFLNKQCLFEI